ncbi:MAG: hypothetical protein ABI665_03425 [Vicinamibacterales bacterium]
MTRSTIGLVLLLIAALDLAACSSEPPASPKPAEKALASVGGREGSLGTVYVTNELGGDLSVVDVATEKVIATIPLGKRPRGLRASADGALLYVALTGSPFAPPGVDESTLPPPDKLADGIGVVDVKARKLLKVIPGGSDPEQVEVSADGTRLFVANEDVALASVLDVKSDKVVATVKVGRDPEGVNIRPDGTEVYVTSETDNAVYVIDALKPRLLKKILVGPRPRSTTFLPDSSRAYVPAEEGALIVVLDTKTRAEITRIPLAGEMQRPMGGVMSPDGKFLYMTTGRGKTVVIIDTATNQVIGSVEVGERPWGIAISRDGSRLFTANGPGGDLSIVDTATRRVTARIKVGDRPWGVVFLP